MLPVQAPGAQPPLHSLLSVANVYTPDDLHWEGGVTFFPQNCGDAYVWAPCVSGDCGPTYSLRFDALTADFTVGETVLGATSFGTGIITRVDIDNSGTAGTLYLSDVASDPFTDDETLESFSPAGNYLGEYDAAAQTPNYPSGTGVSAGDYYVLTTSGTLGTVGYTAGNRLVADVDTPTNADADWSEATAVTGSATVNGTETLLEKGDDCCVDCAEVTVDPFEVYTSITCSTFSAGGAEAMSAKARRQLDIAMHRAIEAEFATGSMRPGNPHLEMGTDVTELNGGAATSPSLAMNFLIDWLGSVAPSGGPGVIHATPLITPSWIRDGDVVEEVTQTADGTNRALRTVVGGHGVVSGGGYPGADRDGTAAGADQAWVYATRAVDVLLGPVRVEADDMASTTTRAINQTTFRAERTVAAFHDECAVAAVLIDLTP